MSVAVGELRVLVHGGSGGRDLQGCPLKGGLPRSLGGRRVGRRSSRTGRCCPARATVGSTRCVGPSAGARASGGLRPPDTILTSSGSFCGRNEAFTAGMRRRAGSGRPLRWPQHRWSTSNRFFGRACDRRAGAGAVAGIPNRAGKRCRREPDACSPRTWERARDEQLPSKDSPLAGDLRADGVDRHVPFSGCLYGVAGPLLLPDLTVPDVGSVRQVTKRGGGYEELVEPVAVCLGRTPPKEARPPAARSPSGPLRRRVRRRAVPSLARGGTHWFTSGGVQSLGRVSGTLSPEGFEWPVAPSRVI